MAEVLLVYKDVVSAEDGSLYYARACGSEMSGGTWQGWLEFVDAAGGETLRSGRETTQPNRTDTVYWATGLTPVYLEGALARARNPLPRPATSAPPARFDPPTEPDAETVVEAPPAESILNPFSVFRKGEALLRRQLAAFSVWHLVNIVRAHGLSDLPPTTLNAMAAADLIELIVAGVKARSIEAV
jgi:hypothetical protein